MDDKIEEQPYDARHTPAAMGDHIGNDHQQGFNFPTAEEVDARFVRPERGKAQAYVNELKENGFEPPRYHPVGIVAPENMSYSPIWPHVTGPGLHFITVGALPFTDIGRWSERVNLDDVSTLDLRVILAHLDAAASAAQMALQDRTGHGLV